MSRRLISFCWFFSWWFCNITVSVSCVDVPLLHPLFSPWCYLTLFQMCRPLHLFWPLGWSVGGHGLKPLRLTRLTVQARSWATPLLVCSWDSSTSPPCMLLLHFWEILIPQNQLKPNMCACLIVPCLMNVWLLSPSPPPSRAVSDKQFLKLVGSTLFHKKKT